MSDPTPPPAESSEPSLINPTCSKCSIELLGKRSVCSGCSRSPYCSVECQTLHWPEHKPICKAYQSGELGYLAMKDMQTIVLSLGESTLVGAACCAFRLEKAENRSRLRDEVLVLKVKADPTWVKGQPRRIVLEEAETRRFEETQWAQGLRTMYDHSNAKARAHPVPASNTMITMIVYGDQMAAPYSSSAPDEWFEDLPAYQEEWRNELDGDLREVVLDRVGEEEEV